ncbi:MAG: serine/threonine-protein phosphatase, partial [Deltaproteobacteria bacterium]|nr:serine/threonine-protein phosphatase [Deltaproteobacteria bacterium]
MKISAAGLSDVGLKREGNEDYLAMDNSTQLYIVADGMGGHLAG